VEESERDPYYLEASEHDASMQRHICVSAIHVHGSLYTYPQLCNTNLCICHRCTRTSMADTHIHVQMQGCTWIHIHRFTSEYMDAAYVHGCMGTYKHRHI